MAERTSSVSSRSRARPAPSQHAPSVVARAAGSTFNGWETQEEMDGQSILQNPDVRAAFRQLAEPTRSAFCLFKACAYM